MMEWIIESASTYARDIDNLILLIAILGGFWLLLAEAVFFWLIWKFRHRPGQKAMYITGEKKHETKWIHIPHNLVLVCDIVIIAFAIKVWYDVKQDLPPAEETVQVIGQQWSWRFIHPGLDKKLGTADDVETVDELHIKKDVLYHFKLQSTDVLHSFSIPAFRLKQDAVPGRTITGWFKAIKTGTFDIQCAEMCGIGHGIMGGVLHVETPEEHENWLRTQKPIGTASVLPAAGSGSG